MIEPRRYLSTFAVVSLVFLRLVIGWHFFGEGTKKLEYNRHTGQTRLVFSAEDFLTGAKGPLAPVFHKQIPGDHSYRQLLVVPRQNLPADAAKTSERSAWAADYAQQRAEATKAKSDVPVEFPPDAPYRDWAVRVADDWRALRDRVKAVPGLSDEQKKKADAAYAGRLQKLADYLATETDSVAEYQHELWRIDHWRATPEAGGVPFHDERIATKSAETANQPKAWVSEVRAIESQYLGELRGILNSEQRADAGMQTAFGLAMTSERQMWLNVINIGVTALTISVGICLLLGFLTRLASIAGALFLLAVIATQPPWLPDAAPTMNQIIEMAGLWVLAGTGAGRWLGLDFFVYALFNRRREADLAVAP